jgi:putative SOS response-associated peptidase YedK
MCGRYLLVSNPEAVRALFGYGEQPNFPPRYNVAPGQPIATVRLAQGAKRFALVRWGLLPAWVKDPRSFRPLVNVRSEGIADKPGFRGAFRYRRCLVPADGWYEWQATGAKRKRPFLIRPVGGAPFALAAIWEHYLAPDGSEIETAAILTTDPSPTLAGIHERMPAVLFPRDWSRWLDPDADPAELEALLVPAPDTVFEALEVSTRVNAAANDDPSLIEPAGIVIQPGDPAPQEDEPRLF